MDRCGPRMTSATAPTLRQWSLTVSAGLPAIGPVGHVLAQQPVKETGRVVGGTIVILD